jgi:hypothetical protein
MLQKFKNSIAFRSGPWAHSILNILPDPVYTHAPDAGFNLITVTGKAFLDMLRECLVSVMKAWDTRPGLVITTDGSCSIDEVYNALKWWKGPLEVISWETSRDWARLQGLHNLVDYCEKRPLGKKLCFTLHQASLGKPILWCDADVLWFKHFSPPPINDSFQVRTTVDFQPCYDPALYPIMPDLETTKPWVNTGIMYWTGNMMGNQHVQDLLPGIPNDGNHFTEQTWIALLMHRAGFPFLEKHLYVCFTQDQRDWHISYRNQEWICRHYVGPVRNLFWRDALALRLGI